jgi:predicted adenylyl cyclase CyaB
MPSHIEFKAKCDSIEAFRKVRDCLVTNKGELIDSKKQDDTIFLMPGLKAGLKLREQSSTTNKLISWEKVQEKGITVCKYLVAPITDPNATRNVLSAAIQVYARVIKHREVFQFKEGFVRLDTVEKLGSYIECEVSMEKRSEEEAKKILNAIIKILAISPAMMIERSYADLIHENETI